jgi:hypothetical protein
MLKLVYHLSLFLGGLLTVPYVFLFAYITGKVALSGDWLATLLSAGMLAACVYGIWLWYRLYFGPYLLLRKQASEINRNELAESGL